VIVRNGGAAMSFANNSDQLDQPIRTMRIILAALIAGVLFFMGFVLFQRQTGNQPPAPEVPVITFIALANAFVILIVSFILPSLFAASLRRGLAMRPGEPKARGTTAGVDASDTVRLCMIWTTRTIIRAALLEGGAFFLLIAYLVEGMEVSIIVAAVFLAGLAWLFPKRAGVDSWIEQQRYLLAEERTIGK
jgi:hypothetical protein